MNQAATLLNKLTRFGARDFTQKRACAEGLDANKGASGPGKHVQTAGTR